MTKKELRDLQKHWYKLLEASGFEDCEMWHGDELVLTQPSWHSLDKMTSFEKECREEYYRVISEMAYNETTTFKNETHRYILIRYIEGVSYKKIKEELEGKGMSRCRNSIRFIIRKYLSDWKIKNYSSKELNKY